MENMPTIQRNLLMVLTTTDNVVTETMSRGVSHKAVALLDKRSDEQGLQQVSMCNLVDGYFDNLTEKIPGNNPIFFSLPSVLPLCRPKLQPLQQYVLGKDHQPDDKERKKVKIKFQLMM